MESEIQYDYIIAGGGCAGLTLATRIVSHDKLRDKRILLIDRAEKNQNDRTWCFWEKEAGFFESIVHKSWQELDFISPTVHRHMAIHPYKYKMIRSGDFYQHCNELIDSSMQVDRLRGNIESFSSPEDGAAIRVDGKEFKGQYLFNSTLNGIDFSRPPYISLLQHFRGWIIETSRDIFNPQVATLMDFRISQEKGTAFVYVLPLSGNVALIEYTLFTGEVLPSDEYTQSLKSYIHDYITDQSYIIKEQEDGVIPMTNYPFKSREGNVINIGTAGGQTKASTGYTFQFIQKYADAIVSVLARTGRLDSTLKLPGGRFSWYDSTLLRVLISDGNPGSEVFTRIFRSGRPQHVLRFLDNESNVLEELQIMSRMPKLPFIAAALKEFRSHLA